MSKKTGTEVPVVKWAVLPLPRSYRLGVFHASTCGQSPPVVCTDLGQVCDFQGHTQAHFTQTILVGIHEVQDFIALFWAEIIVIEQLSLAEDLLDTQETITHGVECKIQEVATTLQGLQMVLQFL